MDNNQNLYELMEKMYTEFTQRFQSIENEIKETKSELKSFREETNIRFDTLENKLDNIEVHNANRHVTIAADIKELQSTDGNCYSR